jgi:hypothetical protein
MELVCCLKGFEVVRTIPHGCDWIFAAKGRSFWFNRSAASVEIWKDDNLLKICLARCPDGKVVRVGCRNPVELSPPHVLVIMQVDDSLRFDYLGRLNTDTGELSGSIQLGPQSDAQISPDGRWVAWHSFCRLELKWFVNRRRFEPERMSWAGECQRTEYPGDLDGKYDIDDAGMVWGSERNGLWLWCPTDQRCRILRENPSDSMVPLFRTCGKSDVYLRTRNVLYSTQQEIVWWKENACIPCDTWRALFWSRSFFTLSDEPLESRAFTVGALCDLTIASPDWVHRLHRTSDRLCLISVRNRYFETKLVRETDSLRNRTIASLVRSGASEFTYPDDECRRIAEAFVQAHKRTVMCTRLCPRDQ